MSDLIPYEQVESVALAMVKSGLFQDTKDVSGAVVKILAGREVGLGPFAAMTGIHVIKSKPVLGANLIATLIKNDPRYDYRIINLDDDGCEIEFYEAGKPVGRSGFGKKDAAAAGLAGGDNWKKFPRNMYFARAISNGAKWFAAGVFGGAPIYSPDEFGLSVDEDGDPIIEATVREPMPRPEQVTNGNGNGAHGEPETLPFQWIMTAGLVDNLKHAANMANLLKLADLPEGEQRDRVALYRAWRDYGLDTKPAAAHAIAGNLPDVEPEGEAE